MRSWVCPRSDSRQEVSREGTCDCMRAAHRFMEGAALQQEVVKVPAAKAVTRPVVCMGCVVWAACADG